MYELTLLNDHRTALGHIQTWRVHHAGKTSQGYLLEVDLFKSGKKWHAWMASLGNHWKQTVANGVAETINALEGNV